MRLSGADARRSGADGAVAKKPGDVVVALVGNPNVGKSTLFNALTGMRQHTGNWPGKTVSVARGVCERNGRRYVFVDLPGTYSLGARSREEEITRDFVASSEADVALVVLDATCLERSLNLALQTLCVAEKTALCVNLMDEAEKKGISVDLARLGEMFGAPAAGTSARSSEGFDSLFEVLDAALALPSTRRCDACADCACHAFEQAESICAACVRSDASKRAGRDLRIDRILTGKYTAAPLMLLLLLTVFYITLKGANYPSQMLSNFFSSLEAPLLRMLLSVGLPELLCRALTEGMYRVLAWVVSVMLPPMAIFFPLFTLLEDLGYLPRVAFNLDESFRRCRACGKQSLTMLMGFGCNAAGVSGCRIIDSPRERLIAILTNSFVPCNGRFPLLIALITMFFAFTGGSGLGALLLTLCVLAGVGMTFLASRLLSATLLRGLPSSFVLELPPYRMPQVGRVIVRSIFDRTLFVLGRAMSVAAPAGLVIWLLANAQSGGAPLLSSITSFLDPFARVFGLDGVLLAAFALGFPANEIVLPVAVMAYLQMGSVAQLPALGELRALLEANGWTWTTALCTLAFSLFHWPCSTTLLSVKKETGSWGWTLAAALLPTLAGFLLCFLIASASRLFGY